jgi:TonB family protein
MLRVLIALCAGFIASAGFAAAGSVQLDPAGPWRVDYADDGCVLSRPFSAAGARHDLGLTFRPLQKRVWLRIRSSEQVRARDDEEIKVDVDDVTLKDLVHFNIYRAEPSGTVREFLFNDFARQVGGVQRSFRFRTARHGELLLNAKDIAKALQSTKTCVDDLHRSLGIDPALLATLKSEPEGYSGEFIELPDFRDQFEYHILYWVTPEGRVEDCRLLRPTGNKKFDQNACIQLEKKGRFKPARNAAGEAVRAPVYEDPVIRRTVIRS